MTDSITAALRVSAHVLVQLGSELVTDVEQAILECVKNAYDADSPGCRIEIETREVGERIERGPALKLLHFSAPSETVGVALYDTKGQRLDGPNRRLRSVNGDELIERHLHYTGRVTIEDHGDGLSPDKLRDSWLVISRSAKRGDGLGPKPKTKKHRTPLGDKGLGRLGSMKLGDILLVESAISPNAPLASAQFRWKDCETAETVDQVPVYTTEAPNLQKFKGTRVSVLGLRDMPEWRRKDRILEITRSLARLISPFEATSKFPVSISLDGKDQSLVSVTNEVLGRAIAEFAFAWEIDSQTGKTILVAKAKFRKRLFTSARSDKQRQKSEVVFNSDEGKGFIESLNSYSRLKVYDQRETNQDGAWFIELTRQFNWSDMLLDSGASIIDPGLFTGSFYFFHLDQQDEPDVSSAAGIGVDAKLIKDMSGISILRDGFRVRSQGDWLGLSSGMTSGSIYHMRVNNTIGYFSLSGEQNFRLTEKSDREGFVEDAAFRGFMQIATTCKDFANDALENVRRALDEYYKKRIIQLGEQPPRTAESSIKVVEESMQTARDAKSVADRAVVALQHEITKIEGQEPGSRPSAQAMKLVRSAVTAISQVQKRLEERPHAERAVDRLKLELDENKDKAAALYESAAVGLSARGLAHELRTHLGEIKQRTTALQREAKKGLDEATALPHLRAIRGACTQISSAAALIDPMLPRSRSLKETFDVSDFVKEYFANRQASFEREAISTKISSSSNISVRGSRARMLQIIDNVVQNSVYWLRRTQMTGELTRPKVITVEVTSFGFTIFDSGLGVDPKYEDSLFEIFVTAKPTRDNGQGLGLFIVTQLLQMDGCEIRLAEARNKDGRRNKFMVDLRPLIIKG